MNTSMFQQNMTFGAYRLLEQIGTGQSGEVWSALSRDDARLLALKIFCAGEDASQLAEYEFRMATKFDHINILRPSKMEIIDTYPVIVMPLCEGRSVDSIAGNLSQSMAWRLLYDISSALTCIHAQGYGHFDIKPSNILWDGTRYLVTDFSSCISILGNDEARPSSDSSSFCFDAPERHLTPQTVASDIWSLGATVFYLFMGCHIFNGMGGGAQQENTPLPYMRKSMPELSTIVTRCLFFSPRERATSETIEAVAEKQLEQIRGQKPARPIKLIPDSDTALMKNHDFWPDEMIEK